ILDRYEDLWPAPLSVVLALKNPIAASRGQAKVAVRIPASPDLVRLLDATGPLTATSANRSGEPPLADPDEVARLFDDRIDLLVDGGETPGGLPSTIVDATVEPPVLLRAGAFPWPCWIALRSWDSSRNTEAVRRGSGIASASPRRPR